MQIGRNVRTPSLVAGNHYVMREWVKKEPLYTTVLFEGFYDGEKLLTKSPKKLKDMLASDVFRFVGEDGESFDGKMVECALIHGVKSVRITFSETASAAPASAVHTAPTDSVDEPVSDATASEVPNSNMPVEAVAEEAAQDTVADEVVVDKEAVAEEPSNELLGHEEDEGSDLHAQHEDHVEEEIPENESAEDKKRRQDRDRKRSKRLMERKVRGDDEVVAAH